jgi:hypothetical protein
MVLACAFWSSQGNNSLNVFDHKTFLLLISCKVWNQMSCMWSIGMNVFDIIYSLMEYIHDSPRLWKQFKNPPKNKKSFSYCIGILKEGCYMCMFGVSQFRFNIMTNRFRQ